MDSAGELNALIDEIQASDRIVRLHHDRVLSLLAESDMESLPRDLRLKAAEYIEHVVLTVAEHYSLFSGGRNRIVDESEFKDEFAQLTRITASLSYSPALKDWMEMNYKNMIHRNLDEFKERISSFSAMSPDEKIDYARQIVRRTIEAHSSADLPLSMPDVACDPDIKGTTGAATTNIEKSADGRILTEKICINFNEAALNNKGLFVLAYHEAIHAITMQLAEAVQSGRIDPLHPLYADSSLRLSDLLSRRPPHPSVASYYKADFEESLACGMERRFMNDLTASETKPEPGPEHLPCPPAPLPILA